MSKSDTKDPFDGLKLNEEERTIEEALERGDFEEVPDSKNTKAIIQEAARPYLKLNKTKS